jgi:hypothetical protein
MKDLFELKMGLWDNYHPDNYRQGARSEIKFEKEVDEPSQIILLLRCAKEITIPGYFMDVHPDDYFRTCSHDIALWRGY